MTTSRERFIEAARKQQDGRPILLVEIERPILESEEENPPVEPPPDKLRYATTALSADGKFYEERLVPPSGIIRETQVLGTSFRSNRISFELMDHDNEVGKFLASGRLYGRAFEIKAGFEELDLDDYQTLFYGQIEEFSSSGGKASITGTDESPRMPQLPEGKISEKDFTSLPDSSKNATLPIVLGSVEETGGAIQAIRLSATEYGVASHRVCNIRNVYVDGALKAEGTDYSLELRKVKTDLGFYAQIKFNAAVNENAVVRADVDGVGSDFINLRKHQYQGTAILDQGVVLNGSSEWLEGGAGTFGVSNADFTLEAGFTHNQYSHSNTICALGDEITAGMKRWKLWIGTDNKIYFAVVRTDTGSFETAVSTKTVVPGSYNRVKLVWDETDKSVHFYVNEMDSNLAGFTATASVGADDVPFRIGALVNNASWSVGSYLSANIHSLRVKAGISDNPDPLTVAECIRAWEFAGNLNDSKGVAHLTKTSSTISYVGQISESETLTAIKLNGSNKRMDGGWAGCGTSNNNFTVEARIKHVWHSDERTLCTKGNEYVGGQQRWKINVTPAGKLKCYMGKSTGNGFYGTYAPYYESTATLSTSQFNRVKMVWEHAIKRLTIYVNGTQSGQWTLPSDAQPGDLGLPFRVGCAYNTESDLYFGFFDGDIDYLRIRHAADSNGNELTVASSNRAWEFNNSLVDSKGVVNLTGSGIYSSDYNNHTITNAVPGAVGFNFPGGYWVEAPAGADSTSNRDQTIYTAFKATALTVFRTICHKGSEEGSDYGWKLVVNADKTVSFFLANATGTAYLQECKSTGTITEGRYQNVKVVWQQSLKKLTMYLNGVFDKAWTGLTNGQLRNESLPFKIGATYRNRITGYGNVFGGSIDFVRIKNSADANGAEVTAAAANQAWEFVAGSSAYTSKLGSRMFLKTQLASSYQNPIVGYNYYYNWPYLRVPSLSLAIDQQLTLVKKFRLNGAHLFERIADSTNYWNLIYLDKTFWMRYDYVLKKLQVYIWDLDITLTNKWKNVLDYSLPEGLPVDEWVDLIVSIDAKNGRYKLIINRELVCNPMTTVTANLVNDSTFFSNCWANFPENMDVDYLGVSNLSTYDRRNPMPKPHEFKAFWDFENGNRIDCIGGITMLVTFQNTEAGKTYDINNHYSFPAYEKNNPAQDVREALHLLGERANAESIRRASDSFSNRSLVNTVTTNGTQWGGCIPKSAQGAESGRDILEKLARNCDSILTVGVTGDWSLKPMNFDSLPAEDMVEYRANEEILKDSFSVSYQSDLQNTGDANWCRKYRKLEEKEEEFGRKERMGVEQSVVDLGREYESDPDEYDFVRGEKMAADVALSRMRKRAKAIPTASFKVPLVGMQSDIGDVVYITHPDGPSKDGRGWDKKPMTVERLSLDRNSNTVDMRVVGRDLHPEAVFGWGSGDTEIIETVLYPELDLYVDSADQNTNQSASSILKAGGDKSTTELDIERACFRFDLSTLPVLAAGEELISVTFDFYAIPTGKRSGFRLREIAKADLSSVPWGSGSTFRNFASGSYWNDLYVSGESLGDKLPAIGSNQIEFTDYGKTRVISKLTGKLDIGFAAMNGIDENHTEKESYDISSNEHPTESQRPKLTIKIKRNKGE